MRKDKRAEQLQKKRFGAVGMPMAGAAPDNIQSVGSQAWLEANPTALVEGVHSDDPTLQLPAVTQFRKLLSIERSPPIEEVIAAGVVPRFVQFLQVQLRLASLFPFLPRYPVEAGPSFASWHLSSSLLCPFRPLCAPASHSPVVRSQRYPEFIWRFHAHDEARTQIGDNPMLQFESAWALTNIASGTSEHTRVVIANGAVPIFVQLLMSPNDDVREQVAAILLLD